MDKNMKKAIVKNRVKLLGLDYFDLTAPLLASEIFPSKKHKEIKGQAPDSKARVDLLLEWMEESAPKEAFPIFLQGIRNCKELILAKKIKREASGKELGATSTAKPKANTASSVNLDELLAEIIPSLPTVIGNKAPAAPKAKTPKAKAPKPKADAAANSGASAPPINGLPAGSLSLPPPPVPKPKKRKAEGDVKVKAEKPVKAAKAATKTAATPKNEKAPSSRSSTPKGTAGSAAAAAAAAAAAIAVTPRATRKSSSSDIAQPAGKGKGGKPGKAGKGTPAPKKGGKQEKKDAGADGSPNKSKAPKVAVSAMSFKEVEQKQQEFKNKFKFTNNNAVARSILFKDKSDITYLGCPFMANNKMCGKKVELKSKEFICEAKHKSPNCRQIPRLQLTCNDGTADLILTLMKQNVEIFTGKSETDIETMSVAEIQSVLEKSIGKKMNVEVTCEKAKKQGAKKGAPIKWNNVATIIDDNDAAPPAKKSRKN